MPYHLLCAPSFCMCFFFPSMGWQGAIRDKKHCGGITIPSYYTVTGFREEGTWGNYSTFLFIHLWITTPLSHIFWIYLPFMSKSVFPSQKPSKITKFSEFVGCILTKWSKCFQLFLNLACLLCTRHSFYSCLFVHRCEGGDCHWKSYAARFLDFHRDGTKVNIWMGVLLCALTLIT